MRSWMIAYLSGCLLMAQSPWLLPPALAWLLLPLALYGSWRRSPLQGAPAGLLVALALASLWGGVLLESRLDPACNRVPLAVTGTVAGLPRVTPLPEGRRQRFEFTLASVQPGHCAGPARVLLSYYGDAQLGPGERWSFRVLLRRPHGLANPGSFNVEAWYSLSGIHAVGSVQGHGERLDGGGGWRYWHHRQRRLVSHALDSAGLSPVATAVLKALTVADKSGIDHRLWQVLQAYGINHLLVISGLHVAMLAGLAFLAGRALQWAGRSLLPGWCCSRLPEVAAFGCAALYTAMAGFSVATSRALVMLAMVLLARLWSRQGGGFHGLLVAACLLLLLNPLQVLGSGFWLSFSAVAVLFWQARWQRPRRGVLGAVLPQCYMAVAMLPLGALWFGGGSLVAPASNLLMIPLAGFYVVPLALAGGVAVLAGAEGAGQLCWQLAALPVDRLWPGAAALAESRQLLLPLSAGRPAAALASVAVAALALPLRPLTRGLAAALLLPLVLPPAQREAGPSLHLLDVGQGTAVVFTAGGRTLVYDTGGGNPAGPNLAASVVLPWLRQRGVGQLDTLVISHADLDHSAGRDALLRALPVRQLFQGEGRPPCRAGRAWDWPGQVRFQFLAPAGAAAGNNASCVLLIDAPGMRVLLPGDIDSAQELELLRYWRGALRADVLLLGHHGSRSSSSQAWLNAVAPAVLLVGAGYASRFGHPHPQVLRRVEAMGLPLYQSAHAGAVEITPGRAGLEVRSFRKRLKTWWM